MPAPHEFFDHTGMFLRVGGISVRFGTVNAGPVAVTPIERTLDGIVSPTRLDTRSCQFRRHSLSNAKFFYWDRRRCRRVYNCVPLQTTSQQKCKPAHEVVSRIALRVRQ
jgi:hypothetical protein